MPLSNWLLIALSASEMLLLIVVFVFFWRLRKSEAIIGQLQGKQASLLSKLQFNAQLEQELVSTFERRQAELARLDEKLEARVQELEKLLKQAEKFSRSPQFLREIILQGHKRGQSSQVLARSTGLSVDEVELIIEQSEL